MPPRDVASSRIQANHQASNFTKAQKPANTPIEKQTFFFNKKGGTFSFWLGVILSTVKAK